MSYIDTSVLVSFYCPEPRSPKAEQAVLDADVRGLSWLVEAEFIATITAKLRARLLSRPDVLRIRSQFQEHVRSAAFTLWPVGRDDFDRAIEFLGNPSLGLQTLDALHLAIAAGHAEDLITADHRLAAAAERLGLPVSRIS